MSADRPTDSILDLLYGEVSEEEAVRMREELAESADLQAELTSYEDLLAKVRESMPVEEVSDSTHASIMDAARAATKQTADGPMTRMPEPGRAGFWSRVGRGQGSQLALVAAVLVAGLFVVKYVQRGDSMRPPASDISAAREAAPAFEAAKSTEEAPAEEPSEATAADAPAPAALDKLAEGGEAVADQWSSQKPAEVAAPTPADESDLRKSLEAELARGGKGAGRAEKTARPAKRMKRSSPKVEAPPAKPKSTSTRKANRSKSATGLEDMLGGDGFFADDNESTDFEAKKEQRSYGADRDDGSVLDLKKKDSVATGEVTGAMPDTEPAPAPQQEPAEAAEAEEQRYEPPANSIGSVNSYFRRNDYAGAIRTADEFLATNPTASKTDKARAIHVKAQSLAKLGRYSEADRLLDSLQKNYPNYQPDSVNAAREELKRKKSKKRRTKKRKPKADKKAMEAPSSVDSLF